MQKGFVPSRSSTLRRGSAQSMPLSDHKQINAREPRVHHPRMYRRDSIRGIARFNLNFRFRCVNCSLTGAAPGGERATLISLTNMQVEVVDRVMTDVAMKSDLQATINSRMATGDPARGVKLKRRKLKGSIIAKERTYADRRATTSTMARRRVIFSVRGRREIQTFAQTTFRDIGFTGG